MSVRRPLHWLLALLAVAAAGILAASAVASGSDAPITSNTVTDPTGDSGSGPDISSFTAQVDGDGTVTLTATIANRPDGLDGQETVQFFLTTPSGGPNSFLNISTFPGQPTELDFWNGTSWEGQHELSSWSWSGGTFTVSDSIRDLQDAMHEPVQPVLDLYVASAVPSDAQGDESIVDRAPDSGWWPLETQASAPAGPTTTAAAAPTTTTNAPAPTPTPRTTPTLQQATARVAGQRVEWKRLAVKGVPAGSTVAIACAHGCSLSERPAVRGGVATSRRFVGVPFRAGTAFVVRVTSAHGTGSWFRETVRRTARGSAAASTHGCIASGGRLAATGAC